MNHRCCQRRAVDIPANMQSRSADSQPVRITNISRGGAYVETHCAHQIAIDSIVELDVKLGSHDSSEHTSVQGMVIHQSAAGFGVMFVDEYSRFMQKLCEGLLKAPVIDHSLTSALACNRDIDAP